VSDRLFDSKQEVQTSDDYYTPKWIFDAMGLKFDLDVCAPPGGVSWIPAKRHYSMKDDGLAAPWRGRVWMNPPYSKPTPWVDRFIEHGHGVALVPFTRGMWMSRIWDSDAGLVRMPYNLKFHRNDKMLSIVWATVLVALGDECVEAIARVGKVR
jgi:hypothetical protein